MKRQVFIGLFIFSVLLNIAVGSTIVWHLWWENRIPSTSIKNGSELSVSDLKTIKTAWGSNGPGDLWEKRRQILEKKAELLDIISRNPNDDRALERTLNELTALRAQVEKDALDKVRHILSTLPDDRKQAFLNFLKGRACMGPGMGMGRGRGRHGMMMHGPRNCPRWNK